MSEEEEAERETKGSFSKSTLCVYVLAGSALTHSLCEGERERERLTGIVVCLPLNRSISAAM
jgi:hypothetical protein